MTRLFPCPAFLFLILHFVPPVYAEPVRDLRVGVAVTAEYKKIPEWKEKFRKRLTYTSKIFEAEFKIRIKETVYWTWKPPAGTKDSGLLLEDLIGRYSLAERQVDVIIGLDALGKMTENLNIKDLHVLGRARPFSGYMVIRYPNHTLFKIQEDTVMAHELGHVFGATHTNRPDSIMNPYVDRQIPTAFDPENRGILSMTRSMNFQAGAGELGPQAMQRLLGSYVKLQATRQPFEFYYALATLYLKLDQRQNALTTLKEAARMEADNPRVHYDLGILYSKMGDLNKSAESFSRAAANLNLPSQKEYRASALNLLGGVYFSQQNLDGAYYAWNRALAIEPDNVDYKVNLATVQMKRGKLDASIRTFQSALKQLGPNAKILSNLGYAMQLKGQHPEALRYLKEALAARLKQDQKGVLSSLDEIQPAEIYSRMGAVFMEMNDTEQAVKHFAMACQEQPGADCHKKIGEIYYQQGRYDDAIAHMMQSRKYFKEDPSVYAIMGVAVAKKGDVANAISLFQEGLGYVQDNKTASQFHKNLGHLYMQIGQYDGATREFQYAVSKDWKNRDGHLGLALVSIQTNRFYDARASLKNVLKMSPKHQQAKELLARTDARINELENQEVGITGSSSSRY
ncbi:MAG: tetratricopeptide repeat protein [Candidatus Omnitrophota bacterium]|nr:tetratricopeptide repeat protein [Candidatus Omnitrophota bacterium]